MRATPKSLILVLSLAAAGCASEATSDKLARPAVVQQAVPAPAQAIDTYAGEVRARYESVLGFRVGGKLQQRKVDVGARVREGDELAVLEPQDLMLQVNAARADAAAAKADLALAKAELERHASMLEKRYISQSMYDARRNAYDAAAARLDQANSQLAVAQNQAGYTTLRADHDGVITAVAAETGQVVAAGQPVMTLAHDGDLEVLINVPEGRLAAFTPGQAVVAEIWARDNLRVPGTVREISPEADPASRTYDVRVTLADEAKAAQLGMTARIYLAGEAQADVLLLPLTALHRQGDQPAVWLYEPKSGQVHLKPVEIGRYREDGVTVLAGLAPGQWVVTAGVHKLAEGQPVRPVDASNRPLKM